MRLKIIRLVVTSQEGRGKKFQIESKKQEKKSTQTKPEQQQENMFGIEIDMRVNQRSKLTRSFPGHKVGGCVAAHPPIAPVFLPSVQGHVYVDI